MPVPLYVVDAFTDRAFSGNPAGVCLFDRYPSDDWLQLLGHEMNLSETACLVRRSDSAFELRWFTPAVEVSLCGHATLASAHTLWEAGHAPRSLITFHTKSGPLTATPLPDGAIELDFPARPASQAVPPDGLLEALGSKPTWVGSNVDDWLVEVASEAAVRSLKPDFGKLARVQSRGVMVTARSERPEFDFVSRFFAPAAGIDEDPVTGSAHCCLAKHWGPRLGKTVMTGYQASERGGIVGVELRGERVALRGQAVLVSRGELLIPLA